MGASRPTVKANKLFGLSTGTAGATSKVAAAVGVEGVMCTEGVGAAASCAVTSSEWRRLSTHCLVVTLAFELDASMSGEDSTIGW